MERQKKLTKHEAFRAWLPYGKWVCIDGREVLFNREYQPIWECRIDEVAHPAIMSEHVDGIIDAKTVYFYDDSCPPKDSVESLQICLNALRDFGASWDNIPLNFIPKTLRN